LFCSQTRNITVTLITLVTSGGCFEILGHLKDPFEFSSCLDLPSTCDSMRTYSPIKSIVDERFSYNHRKLPLLSVTAVVSGRSCLNISSKTFLIALCVSSAGILVTASKNKDGGYSYNPTIVVLLTECMKIVAAIAIYVKEYVLSAGVSDGQRATVYNRTERCTSQFYSSAVCVR